MNELLLALIGVPFIIAVLMPILVRPERVIILPLYALYRLITAITGASRWVVRRFFTLEGDGPGAGDGS